MWLTDWDREMVDILKGIAGSPKRPKLELLFFANTFPIAFHYSIAIKELDDDPRKYIELGGWKERAESDLSDFILYTNEKDSPFPKADVTVFKPRWVFAPRSLATSRIYDSIAGRSTMQGELPVGLLEFLREAKALGYSQLWIYAELADLGEYLKEQLQHVYNNAKVFHAQVELTDSKKLPLPIFEEIESHENLLRLFIYGGSLSSYLKRKNTRYLPLYLPIENLSPTTQKLKTYIAGPEEHLEPLKKYHEKLYQDSLIQKENNSECPAFFTVYRRYNELSWLLQHRSSFLSAEEYRRCLEDHHLGNTFPQVTT